MPAQQQMSLPGDPAERGQLRRASASMDGCRRERARRARPDAEDAGGVVDPEEAAERAGLRYVSDGRPGLRRKKSGKGFSYARPEGSTLSDRQVLSRIRSLAIPPAWTDVWICLFADGHIQATGRDARGRKQYRYHPRFREVRESTKYEQSWHLPMRCRRSVRRCASTWRCAASRAKRSSRPSCICWRRRSSGWATTITPGRTTATASPRSRTATLR
jgi:hypothetical protein